MEKCGPLGGLAGSCCDPPPVLRGKGGSRLLGNSYHRDKVEESQLYLSAFWSFKLLFASSVESFALGLLRMLEGDLVKRSPQSCPPGCCCGERMLLSVEGQGNVLFLS